MTTLSRRLAPHARTAWLTLAAASVLAIGIAVLTTMAFGGTRVGIVMTVFTGVVVTLVLAAVLDAILVPASSDVRRQGGYAAAGGWVGAGDAGGGSCGGSGGGDCG